MHAFPNSPSYGRIKTQMCSRCSKNMWPVCDLWITLLIRSEVFGHDDRSVLWGGGPANAFPLCGHFHLCHGGVRHWARHAWDNVYQRALRLVVGHHIHDHRWLWGHPSRLSHWQDHSLYLHTLRHPCSRPSHCYHQRPLLSLLLHTEDEGGSATAQWGTEASKAQLNFRRDAASSRAKPARCLCPQCTRTAAAVRQREVEHTQQRRRRCLVIVGHNRKNLLKWNQ